MVRNGLDAHQPVVRDVARVRLGLLLALLQPRHRVQAQVVHVAVHGHVVAPAQNSELVREPRRAVVESGRRALALERRLRPRRRDGVRRLVVERRAEIEDVQK